MCCDVPPHTPHPPKQNACFLHVVGLNGLEVLIGPKFFCVDLSHDWLKTLGGLERLDSPYLLFMY